MSSLSYRSPKTVVTKSQIHGRGLFAREPIAKGEIVAIKGGYIFDAATLRDVEPSLGPAQITIADGFYIGPLAKTEREGGMLFSNHSCDPNIDARHPTRRGAHPRLGDHGRRLVRDAMPLRGTELPRDHHGAGLAA
jgi:SET domain-containing protein